jgi:hypothetical protein
MKAKIEKRFERGSFGSHFPAAALGDEKSNLEQ